MGKLTNAEENGFYLQLLRSYIDSANDAIFVLCDEMKFLLCNQLTETWLGESETVLTKHNRRIPITQFFGIPESESLFRKSFHASLEGVPKRIECFIRPGKGIPRWVEMNINKVDLDSGLMVIIVARDITDRKQNEEEKQQLQAQFLQAQKLESVGRLAGGIAHDFNNLLTIIIGYCELALWQSEENNESSKYFKIISDAGKRAEALTSQLLAFSRKQTLEMKVVNLNTIIENIRKMLGRLIGENIVLETKISTPVRNVLADPAQIGQILFNLAVNSKDAMPFGGRLTIETADTEIDKEYSGHHANAKPEAYVLMAVSDTGEGMSREVQEKIFEPFFTTKRAGIGTGLGLSTVYGIVKQHNGHIAVETESGEGTTFKIFLPMTQEDIEENHEEASGTIPRGTETILVVDDASNIRRLIVDVLEPLGYRLLEASSGEEALKVSNTFKETIDILLTDVILPRMNGRELAEILKSKRPDTKVIFMSGYTDDIINRHNVRGQWLGFIQKPLTPSKLGKTLREVLMKTRRIPGDE